MLGHHHPRRRPHRRPRVMPRFIVVGLLGRLCFIGVSTLHRLLYRPEHVIGGRCVRYSHPTATASPPQHTTYPPREQSLAAVVVVAVLRDVTVSGGCSTGVVRTSQHPPAVVSAPRGCSSPS